MIEKLPFETKQTEYEGQILTAKTHTNPYDMQVKINELVDAVNGILDYAPREMAMKVEPAENSTNSKMENVAPYAEQRKWVGKLCRFWDDNSKIIKHFGILTRIDEKAIVLYEAENGFWYCACEPVKPTDSVIYKRDDK